jgi:flagellar hook-associated protein 3 FlgL
MSMRITTSMVQRNILADLNNISGKLTRTQMKAASNKEISRPSDDPFGTTQAMALRQSLALNRQHQSNVEDAIGWQDATEQALIDITDAVQEARRLIVQGGTDSSDQTSREAIASELEQIIEGIKQSANTSYRGSFLFSGTATSSRSYLPTSTPYVPADDQFQGDEAGMDPAIPGIIREIGPNVQMTINVVGRDFLGDGPGSVPPDNKLLHVLRDAVDHLRTGDGASLRGTDLDRLDTNFDHLLEVRAANGAKTNRLEAALGRLSQLEESVLGQLSKTEDADMAQTLIDLNSQTAAYQAALRAGASIVQSSLMDFLR